MGAINGTSIVPQTASTGFPVQTSSGLRNQGSQRAGTVLFPWLNAGDVSNKSGKVLCRDGKLRSLRQAERWEERHPNRYRSKLSTWSGPHEKLSQEDIRKIAVRQIRRQQEGQREASATAISDRAEEAETSLAVRPNPVLTTAVLTAANWATSSIESADAAPAKRALSQAGLWNIQKLAMGEDAAFELHKSKHVTNVRNGRKVKESAPELIVIANEDPYNPKLQHQLADILGNLAKRNRDFKELLVEWGGNISDLERALPGKFCNQVKERGERPELRCVPVDQPKYHSDSQEIIRKAYENFVVLANTVCAAAQSAKIKCGPELRATSYSSDHIPPLSRAITKHFLPLLAQLNNKELFDKCLDIMADYNVYAKEYSEKYDNEERCSYILNKTAELVDKKHISVLVADEALVKALKDRFLEQEKCWILLPRVSKTALDIIFADSEDHEL